MGIRWGLSCIRRAWLRLVLDGLGGIVSSLRASDQVPSCSGKEQVRQGVADVTGVLECKNVFSIPTILSDSGYWRRGDSLDYEVVFVRPFPPLHLLTCSRCMSNRDINYRIDGWHSVIVVDAAEPLRVQ